MLLKLGSLLLLLWGLLNAVGGVLGARSHTAPWIGVGFAAVGLLIASGGVGFWRGRPWATAVSAIGLLGLSAVALLSASILRGAEGVRLSHHLVRFLLSASAFATAFIGARRARRKTSV